MIYSLIEPEVNLWIFLKPYKKGFQTTFAKGFGLNAICGRVVKADHDNRRSNDDQNYHGDVGGDDEEEDGLNVDGSNADEDDGEDEEDGSNADEDDKEDDEDKEEGSNADGWSKHFP